MRWTAREGIRYLMVIVLSCGFSAACADDQDDGNFLTGPSSEELAAAGTYILRTINGAAPPVQTIPSPPNPCPGTMNSGRLTLTTDPQRYELLTSSTITCLTNDIQFPNTGDNGTWSLQGGTMTFTTSGSQNYNLSTGVLAGTALTIPFNAPHQNAGNPAVRVTTTWSK